MDLTVIDDIREVYRLADEWATFVDRHAAATPFHHPLWLLTWWKHFGSGSLQFLTFREGTELCCVLPCFLLEWEGRQQLTLIGSGISDYLDPLIQPGAEVTVAGALASYLEHYDRWEVVDWTDLSPSHPFFSLRGVQQGDWIPRGEIVFTGTFEDFFAARGADLRRNVRRYREKAEQVGPVEFKICESGSRQLTDTLIRLHAKRWQSQGKPGMIAANHSAEFLSDVAIEMSKRGLVRFFSLSFRSEVVALQFALAYKRRIYGYMSAFDPDHGHLSFGQTLLYEAIRDSFPKYEAWDFLRGDEPYKSHWGGQFYARAKLRLERSSLA